MDRAAKDADTTSLSSNTTQMHVENLRRVKDSVPGRLWIVATISFCERAAFWGVTAPWQNFMEHPKDYADGETPGALGLGQAQATRIYCSFYIFYYVIPIFVAFVADGKLGQYRTLLASIVLYCLGILILTISSTPTNLTKFGLPGLVVAMVLIGLGGGGVKAILPPFIADQYKKTAPKIKTLETGERVVTDYDLTIQYIYNMYYWIGNIGSLSWFATVFIERHYGFAPAYGLTLGLMVVALFILLLGKRWLVQYSHEEDKVILSQASKIIACAMKNGGRMRCASPTHQTQSRHKTVPWTQDMVDELTRGLRCCRVLLSFIMFYVCFDQMQNNLISQAGQMNTHGAPNDLIPGLNQVGCIVMGPVIQMGLHPLLHRRRIYLGPINRIAIGFIFVTLSMLYATVVQYAIYTAPPCSSDPSQCSSLSSGNSGPNVWLQAPIYVLISTGEVFALVTGLEYAYDHSPQGMKVIVQAINLLIAGLGSVVALSLTTVAHDPNLIIFYGSIAGAMGATTIIFWLLFRKYDKIEKPASKPGSFHTSQEDIETGLPQYRGEARFSSGMPTNSTMTLVGHDALEVTELTRLRSTSDTTLVPAISRAASPAA